MKVLVLLLCTASALKAQSTQELVTMGDALDEQNRNSERLAIYLKSDATQPNDAEILWRISKQYAQLVLDTTSSSKKAQLGGKAFDAATRVVAADPNYVQAHLALAIVYGRLALEQSARRKIELSELIKQEAEKATRLDPGNDIAWYVLGALEL